MVAVYVLVAIVRKGLNLHASPHIFSKVFSLTLSGKMPIQPAFAGSDCISGLGDSRKQLNPLAFLPGASGRRYWQGRC